jgi:hypothetical protein
MKAPGRFAPRPWTEADDAKLRALALKGMDTRAIGIQMDRTEISVRNRARRLHVILKRNSGSRRPTD